MIAAFDDRFRFKTDGQKCPILDHAGGNKLKPRCAQRVEACDSGGITFAPCRDAAARSNPAGSVATGNGRSDQDSRR